MPESARACRVPSIAALGRTRAQRGAQLRSAILGFTAVHRVMRSARSGSALCPVINFDGLMATDAPPRGVAATAARWFRTAEQSHSAGPALSNDPYVTAGRHRATVYPMDADLQKRALAALDGKLTKACPHCGMRKWTLGEIVNLQPSRPDGAIVIGGPVVPVLLVVCNGCKGIASFSVVGLGLNLPAKVTNG